MTVSEPSLAERISVQDGLSPEVAERRLFWRSIVPWRRPVVWVLRNRWPQLFGHDLHVIGVACRLTRRTQLSDLVDQLYHRRPEHGEFITMTLGFRISANRLIGVAKEYFLPEATLGSK